MVFSSLIFLFFFLPAVLFCYYIVPQKFIRVRNAVLLLFSLFFYFYGEPILIGILIFSILMNYLFGLSMRSTYRKPLLILCVIANLSLLGIFKYLNFFISTADSLFGLGIPVRISSCRSAFRFTRFRRSATSLTYTAERFRRSTIRFRWRCTSPCSRSLSQARLYATTMSTYSLLCESTRLYSFPRASAAFCSVSAKRYCCPMCSRRIAGRRIQICTERAVCHQGAWMGAIGYTGCRFTSISPATRIWRSVSAKCSASSFSKTSTIRTSASRSPSSGAAGISRCPPGSATMCTFRWVATGARPHGTLSICSPYGR